MNRFIYLSARMVFTAVFLVLTAGLLVWEISGLWGMDKSQNLVVRSEFDNSVAAGTVMAAGDESKEVGAINGLVVAEDARPLIIRRYLAKYKSPLLPYSDLIFQLSNDYGVGYDWVLAIAQQESNLGKKSPEGCNNYWGYGINSKGKLCFESPELAFKSYYNYLKLQYFDKGLNTEELIMRKYCPHSNGSWAYGVKQFREQINSGVF